MGVGHRQVPRRWLARAAASALAAAAAQGVIGSPGAPSGGGAAAAQTGVAGNDRHLWLATESASSLGGMMLLHTASDRDAFELTVAGRLDFEPILSAALGQSVVFALPATVSGNAGEPGERVYPLRRVRAWSFSGGLYRFDRPEALPPLFTEGELVALAGRGDDLIALTWSGAGRAPSGVALRRLVGDRWRDLPAAEDWRAQTPVDLALGPGGVVVLTTGEQGPTLWSRALDDGAAWSDRPAPGLSGDSRLVETGGVLLAVDLVGGGPGSADGPPRARLHLVREDRVLARGEISGVPAGARVSAFDGNAVLAWSASADAVGVRLCLVTPAGEVIANDRARIEGPVSAQDVQLLTFLLGSVFLTAMLFVLRPDGARRGAVVLPEGVAIAEPWRRVTAGALDVLPAMALVSLVPEAAREPAAAVLLVAGATVLHTSVGEAVAGRTIGKLLMRTRTVSLRTGKGPGPAQAVGRSVVKVLCPPLAVVLAMQPADPLPGSLGTITVIDIDDSDRVEGNGAGRGS